MIRPLQEGFRPAKYFSIDRVFRNEAIDRTHLAEFHQIEGERVLQYSRLIGGEVRLKEEIDRTHRAEFHQNEGGCRGGMHWLLLY